MSGSAAPLVIAFAALGLSAVTLFNVPATKSGSELPNASLTHADERLAAVERKLGELSDDFDANTAAIRVDDKSVTKRRDAIASRDANTQIDALRKRLAELESRIKRMEATRGASTKSTREQERRSLLEKTGAFQARNNAKDAPTEAETQKMRTTAMNAAQSEEQRLEALGALRGIEGGRDANVVASMIHLAQTSKNGDTRADIWRQMSRAKDPQLIAPMLHALQTDTHAKAREEAAETLGDFNDRGDVRAALEHASKQDADAGVRRQAAESLNQERR